MIMLKFSFSSNRSQTQEPLLKMHMCLPSSKPPEGILGGSFKNTGILQLLYAIHQSRQVGITRILQHRHTHRECLRHDVAYVVHLTSTTTLTTSSQMLCPRLCCQTGPMSMRTPIWFQPSYQQTANFDLGLGIPKARVLYSEGYAGCHLEQQSVLEAQVAWIFLWLRCMLNILLSYSHASSYWQSHGAKKRLTTATKVSENITCAWLKKQATWEIYQSKSCYIPSPYFRSRSTQHVGESCPTTRHIFMLSSFVDTSMDFKCGPLTSPELLQTDPGHCLMAACYT